MLLLLVGTLAVSIFWFAIGRQFLSLVAPRHPADRVSIEWTMLLGAFVLAAVSQAVHFVLPLRSTGSAMMIVPCSPASAITARRQCPPSPPTPDSRPPRDRPQSPL